MGLGAITMAMAAALWLPVASAQNMERPVPRPVLRMVDALDSDDLSTREDATEELKREVLRPGPVNPAMIQRLIHDPDLSPEQRARLILVDRSSFANSPRAAMGIRFAITNGAGVGINQTYPKFPSFKVLQPGDVILTADGQEMSTQDDLRFTILSRDPGDVLSLKVQRGEDIIECEVELGFYNNLEQPRLPEQTLDRAWERRMRRLSQIGSESEPVIDARGANGNRDADESAWRGADRTWDDQARTHLAQGGGARIVADPFVVDSRLTMQRARTQVLLRNNAGQFAQVDKSALANLQRREEAMRSIMQTYIDRLAQPGLTPNEQIMLERQIEAMRLQVERIEEIREQGGVQRQK